MLSSRLFNEARFGYGLLETDRSQDGAFRFSEVGITSAPQNDDLPGIAITGSYKLASSAIGKRSQRTFLFEDSLSWVLDRHNVQVGGGFTKALRDFDEFRQPGGLTFQSFPDFLLGPERRAERHQPVQQRVRVGRSHGAVRSGIAELGSVGLHPGQLSSVSSRLTVNAGVRWEYLPPLTDATGRPTTVDAALLDPNPPAQGSLAGIVVRPISRRDSRRRVSDRYEHRARPGEDAHARSAHGLCRGRCSATRAAS